MLTFAWKSWRDVVGPPSKPRFVRLVELSNAAAKRNGELMKISAVNLKVKPFVKNAHLKFYTKQILAFSLRLIVSTLSKKYLRQF